MKNVIQKRKDAADINDVNKTLKSVQIVLYIGGARVEKEIRKYHSVSKYFKLSDNCPKIPSYKLGPFGGLGDAEQKNCLFVCR